MKYLLIGAEMHTLPMVTEISGENLEEAKVSAATFILESQGEWETIVDEDGNESYQKENKLNNYHAFFLVDMEKGEIRRPFFNEKRELQLTSTESAFMPLGVNTVDSHFQKEAEAGGNKT